MSATTKSHVYCCVPQCSTYYGGDVSFHKFPANKLKKEWIRILKIGKNVSQSMRVCTYVNEKPRLKSNVVPTQNLPKSSHQKEINRTLLEKREERRNKRARLVQENIREPSTSEQPLDCLEERDCVLEETTTNPQDIEIADILLSLNKPTEHKTKTYEDKAVQVNTAEEFKAFDVGDIINTENTLKVLTGLPNFALLNVLVGALVAFGDKKCKLSMKKVVLLTMMRIKLDLTFAALAVLFNVSSRTAKTYFHTTVTNLALILKQVIRLPPKEEILNNMPKCFAPFKHTLIVLDCTEIEIQRSKCLSCRIKSYSFYKGRHTVKFLIGATPSGLISFVSKPYGGRASDKAIFNRENLLAQLEPPGACMVDKGFLIDKECAEHNISLIRPPFLRKKKQLTKGETVQNVRIAKARVHIERLMQRIKMFRVCRNTVPWSLLPYMNSIMIVVTALTNLSQPILTSDKFT